jgi:hypothetical protein
MRKEQQELQAIVDRVPRRRGSVGILGADEVGDVGQVLGRAPREAELHFSKRRNAASTSASVANFAAPRLSEALEHIRKMRRIDRLDTGFRVGEAQHRLRDLVLLDGRQAANDGERFFEKLGHGCRLGILIALGKRGLR